MMYKYSRYNLETGRFTGQGSNSDQDNVSAKDGEGLIDGHYDQSTKMVVDGSVVDIPAFTVEQEEIDRAWVSLKGSRNMMLQSTDWTQVPDAPVDQAAWAVYRQELRDLPANTEDPNEVVWPKPPTS
jgi:hypothetical protein